MKAEILRGDCRELIAAMPDNSVDSVVTDPPYELGFMGKAWDSTGIAYDPVLWAECLRVLKPGGHLLAFGGSRTYHRLACAVEEAGFEIRDQIMWVYGSGFPKSHNLKDDWEGWGTALKPAHEPIVVARKPLIGSVAANVLEWGTGAINIDGCRVDGPGAMKWDSVRGGIWKTDSSASGVLVQNDKGRWPANFVHDGSDEVTELLGEANRFFYCAKPSNDERNAGLDHLSLHREHDGRADGLPGGDNPRNRTNKPKRNFHPTVKPVELMRYLVRLVTPPGGIVIDPFAGSGTTLVAAVLEGVNAIGCELTEEYLPIIEGRLAWAKQTYQPTLFTT